MVYVIINFDDIGNSVYLSEFVIQKKKKKKKKKLEIHNPSMVVEYIRVFYTKLIYNITPRSKVINDTGRQQQTQYGSDLHAYVYLYVIRAFYIIFYRDLVRPVCMRLIFILLLIL